MRDYLAWRLAFGVTTPSTNTVVQPEYDDMRPAGVTNHLARMVIDDPVTSDADFEKQLEAIDKSLEDAVDRVMDAKPNAFILGISALSVWGGTLELALTGKLHGVRKYWTCLLATEPATAFGQCRSSITAHLTTEPGSTERICGMTR